MSAERRGPPVSEGSEGVEWDVLGNMSSRPRTDIRRDVPDVHGSWTLFDLHHYRGGDEPDVIDGQTLARLDARWASLGLTGASVVIRSRVAPRLEEPLICLDEELILNVILRVRGNLLIHRMPLLDRRDALTSNAVLVPDPRLHAAVLATSHLVGSREKD